MTVSRVFSQDGPTLTFIHANGYPLNVYTPLLNPLLGDYRVVGYQLRPFWPGTPPGDIRDWRSFRDDYLGFLTIEEDGIKPRISPENKVIAVGHSIGAMTSLLAAVEYPELFSAQVLLEPVIFPRWYGLIMRLAAPFKLVRRFHPLIRQTLQRKTIFPDRQKMFENYRKKNRFHRISDDILMDYAVGLSRDLPDGGVELIYRPEWEARIYETAGIADRAAWHKMDQVPCPVLVIRGEDSDTLQENVFHEMVKMLPKGSGITISGAGHLVPLERPVQTAELIIDFLEDLS
jgi:pimeloyl-ACP methyl ester carboxylesterase